MQAPDIPDGEQPRRWVEAADFVIGPTFPAWLDRGSALVRIVGVPRQTIDGVVLLFVETTNEYGTAAKAGPTPIDPATPIGVR